MKIFLSWSGAASRDVAIALSKWLPIVVPDASPWISSENIEKGKRWTLEIATQLATTDVGVVCVLPDNIVSPWLMFEAGAVSKSVQDGRVVPFLVSVPPEQLPGPLSQFQATNFDREDVLRFAKDISRLSLAPVPEDRLAATVSMSWLGLEAEIQQALQKVTVDAPSQSAARPRNDSPNDDESRMLAVIAQSGFVTLLQLPRLLGGEVHGTRINHYLDRLVGFGLIEFDDEFRHSFSRITLTAEGRAYAVQKRLV